MLEDVLGELKEFREICEPASFQLLLRFPPIDGCVASQITCIKKSVMQSSHFFLLQDRLQRSV